MIPVVGLDPSLTGLGLATPDTLTTITSKPTGDTVADRTARLVTMADKVARFIPDVSLVVMIGDPDALTLPKTHLAALAALTRPSAEEAPY